MNCARRIALLLACMVCSGSVLAETEWLYGTWWYAHADGQFLEGEDRDGMVFKRDGSVDLVDENARTWLTCTWELRTAIQVNLDCQVRGKSRQLRFLISEDRSQIANVEDTDNGFYKRR